MRASKRDRGRRSRRSPRGPRARIGAPPGAPALLLPAVGWEYRFQRPQQLARAAAAGGRPLSRCPHAARAAPSSAAAAASISCSFACRGPIRTAPASRAMRRQSRRLAARAPAGAARLDPRAAAVLAQLGLALRERCGAPLVYTASTTTPRSPRSRRSSARGALFAAADLVVATSGTAARAGSGPPGRIVRNGVASEEFRAAPLAPLPAGGSASSARSPAGSTPRPWRSRAAAGNRFTLAGQVEDPAFAPLSRLANVHLPARSYAAGPAFLAAQDLVLVPFRDTPLTRAVDPVKLYEALAAGVPVVARRLPETARWAAQVALYDDPDALPALLDRELAADDEQRRAARRAAVAAESWAARAAAIERLVAGLIGFGSR